MKEIFFIYIILGSYYAHRKTINVEMSDVNFIKLFIKYTFMYPKIIFSEYKDFNKS